MTVSGPVPERGVGEADRGAGPDTAFDAFTREQRRALVAFAWTLTGDVGVAEDVAQDALHATWQAWDRGGGIRHPEAWARQVVANRAIDRVRRAGRERRALGLVGSRPDPTVHLPTTDHEFWDAVRALPARQAQAIALHYLEDRPVAEIAEILGCAPATVKVHDTPRGRGVEPAGRRRRVPRRPLRSGRDGQCRRPGRGRPGGRPEQHGPRPGG